MPTIRIPLVGTYNERGIDGSTTLSVSEDQRFLNCVFSVVQNPVTGKASVYVEKRPGWGVDSVVAANNPSTGLVKPLTYTAPVSAFGDTNSTIYVGSTSVGVITGRAIHFKETLVSSVSHVMIKSSDGTGWYYVAGAKDQLSYTGNRTSGSAVISGIASTAGMYSGQLITGTGIPANTRILTVDSGTQITLNANATSGAATSTTLTKEPIAKILSANFVTAGTYISSFEEMDGFVFYATDDGNVRNSDLNTVTTYQSTNYVAAQISPDPAVGLVRQKNYLIAFGTASKEAFTNAGNALGSPLQRVPQAFENIGALDQRSIKSMEDVIYFVSTPRNGDVGVYRIKALQAEKISPPSVDKILGTFTASGGSVYTNTFRLGGYPYVGLFVSTANEGPASKLLLESGDNVLLESGDRIVLESASSEVSSFVRFLVYNIGLNIWSEWDCSEATFIEGGSGGVSNILWATSRVEQGGKIYTINPATQGQLWRDDGSTYSAEIRTSKIDHGTNNRKFVHEIRIVADLESTGTVTLEKSDDDYATWQTLGSFDLTSSTGSHIARCGSHVGGRAYRLTHSANGPFRAEAIEIDYSVER